MHDLAPIIRQLRRLLGRDERDQARGRHLARVRGEDPVHLLPDLQLRRAEARSEQRRGEVRVAAPDLPQERAGDGAEEACARGRVGARAGVRARVRADMWMDGWVVGTKSA